MFCLLFLRLFVIIIIFRELLRGGGLVYSFASFLSVLFSVVYIPHAVLFNMIWPICP